jgi:hypothetical protein
MDVRYTVSRSLRLRQSYLDISKIIRSRSWRDRPLHTARPRLSQCQTRAYSTTPVGRTPHPRKEQDESYREYKIGKNDDVDPEEIIKTFRTSCTLPPDPRTKGFRKEMTASESSSAWATFRNLDLDTLPPSKSDAEREHDQVRFYGYVSACRHGSDVDFLQVVDPRLEYAIQVVVPHAQFRSSKYMAMNRSTIIHKPFRISGSMFRRAPRRQKQESGGTSPLSAQGGPGPAHSEEIFDHKVGRVNLLLQVEVHANSLEELNVFHARNVDSGKTFPPAQRHLQFRTDSGLRHRIRLRSRIAGNIRAHMLNEDFDEVETPLLFKSTPEGAREFIVPTRRRGYAYALPQSPQQYKQVLMACGIPKYFQFAKCFRDEDHRADRQPEFTQVRSHLAFSASRF